MESNAQHYARLNRSGHPCAYFGEFPDWLIVAGRHRDSTILENANFEAIQRALTAISPDDVEIESASHWAVGWVESIVINPKNQAMVDEAESILAALENYPVVDDELLSQMESEEVDRCWGDWGADEFRRELVKSLGDEWEPYLDDLSTSQLWTAYTENGGDWIMESDGPYFMLKDAAAKVGPSELFDYPEFEADDIHGFPAMVSDLEAWAQEHADYTPSGLEWAVDRLEHLRAALEPLGYLVADIDAGRTGIWDVCAIRKHLAA